MNAKRLAKKITETLKRNQIGQTWQQTESEVERVILEENKPLGEIFFDYCDEEMSSCNIGLTWKQLEEKSKETWNTAVLGLYKVLKERLED